jgi:hypothetical protein
MSRRGKFPPSPILRSTRERAIAPLRAGSSWAGPVATELVFLRFFLQFSHFQLVFYMVLLVFFSSFFYFADWFFLNFRKFVFFLI